jgi:F-type H+-transporting ATPase subunit b
MLDINLWLLLFVAALFLGLVYLLNDMLYKPLLAFMDKREKSIRDDMASSDKNTDEIDELLTQADQKISVAKGEATKIREEALIAAKDKASKALDEAKGDIEAKYASFVEKLAADRDTLKDSIGANVSNYQSGIKSKIKNI